LVLDPFPINVRTRTRIAIKMHDIVGKKDDWKTTSPSLNVVQFLVSEYLSLSMV